ncbi:MAG: HEAT repeat domain-containing protein [Rhodocyclaceae bacterium]|jgi:hypothetical protein|nr:HEAT repeat domain-containing protein [Rhodocyclaceae bacterium]
MDVSILHQHSDVHVERRIRRFVKALVSTLIVVSIGTAAAGDNGVSLSYEEFREIVLEQHKITLSDARKALRNKSEADLFSSINFFVAGSPTPEAIHLLEAVWGNETDKYPELPWPILNRPVVRLGIAQTLGRLDPDPAYRDYALTQTRSKDEVVAGHAVFALGLIGNDDDVQLLKGYSKSGSMYVSKQAIYGLAALGTKKSKDALTELGAESQGDATRIAIIDEAGSIFSSNIRKK